MIGDSAPLRVVQDSASLLAYISHFLAYISHHKLEFASPLWVFSKKIKKIFVTWTDKFNINFITTERRIKIGKFISQKI